MKTSDLKLIQSCQDSLTSLLQMCPISPLKRKIEEWDHQISLSTFWDNPKAASTIMKDRNKASEYIDLVKDTSEYIELCQNIEMVPEDVEYLSKLDADLKERIFKQMMQDPADNTPAIIAISAGAGGLEAANWVSMLLRMYLRYADSQGFKSEILDEKRSEEHSSICTDSVTIRVEGPYAYGFFKNESGVHRLIRNSPFNAADARQTSFAAVYVSPDIEDTIEIKIDEKDLEITAQTAGGNGGQNVNKVASAIRLKHIPSGINILVRTSRDQLSNRKTAMKMLKARLYDMELKKKQAVQDDKLNELTNVSFGHQVRTYVLTPSQLITDHRSELKVSDAQGVLDGDLKDLIISVLKL